MSDRFAFNPQNGSYNPNQNQHLTRTLFLGQSQGNNINNNNNNGQQNLGASALFNSINLSGSVSSSISNINPNANSITLLNSQYHTPSIGNAVTHPDIIITNNLKPNQQQLDNKNTSSLIDSTNMNQSKVIAWKPVNLNQNVNDININKTNSDKNLVNNSNSNSNLDNLNNIDSNNINRQQQQQQQQQRPSQVEQLQSSYIPSIPYMTSFIPNQFSNSNINNNMPSSFHNVISSIGGYINNNNTDSSNIINEYDENEDSEIENDENNNTLYEKLLPDNQSNHNGYIPSGERKSTDVFFSIIYLIAFICLLVFNDTDLNNDNPLPNFYHLAPIIAVASLMAVIFSICWLLLMKHFARPVVYFTILSIPLLSIIGVGTIGLNAVLVHYYNRKKIIAIFDEALTFAIVLIFIGIYSAYYIYSRKKSIDATISILKMSSDILYENPKILIVSFLATISSVIFTFIWIWKYSTTLFQTNYYLSLFRCVMFFWTNNIIKSLEQLIISAIVGKWYYETLSSSFSTSFNNDDYNNYSKNINYKSSNNIYEERTLNYNIYRTGSIPWSVGLKQFGTASLGSIFIAFVNVLQVIIKPFKPSRGTILSRILDFGGYLAVGCSQYIISRSGLTGESFWKSGYIITNLFRRNLILTLTSITTMRFVLNTVAGILSLMIGMICFYICGWKYDDSQLWMIGLTGSFISWGMIGVVQGGMRAITEATFICWLEDLDNNGLESIQNKQQKGNSSNSNINRDIESNYKDSQISTKERIHSVFGAGL